MNETFSATPVLAPHNIHPTELQRVSRSALERVIGILSHSSDIHEGHTATRLQRLRGSGGLYLTRNAHLVEVHPTEDPERLIVRLFRGTPEAMWESVEAACPDVCLGETLPRFWVTQEPVSGSVVLYGVLDLRAMDILERDCSREAIATRVVWANEHSAAYVQEHHRNRLIEVCMREVPGWAMAGTMGGGR